MRDLGVKLGYKSALLVPMLRERKAIGCIAILRATAGRSPTRRSALAQTFADQAVIAIQNARLFNETKEALEQQTATAEVLHVISESPTDMQPVFDAILESCQQAVRERDGACCWLPRATSAGDVVAGRGSTQARRAGRADRRRMETSRHSADASATSTCTGRLAGDRIRRRSSAGAGAPRASLRRWRRCCGKTRRRRDSAAAQPRPAVQRQGDRAAEDLRRPGGDRDRERAAVQARRRKRAPRPRRPTRRRARSSRR